MTAVMMDLVYKDPNAAYLASNAEESKRFSMLLRQVPDQDLAYLLSRLSADKVLGPFVVSEHELREGTICGWFYRGMLTGRNPDLALLCKTQEIPCPTEKPK